MSASFNFEIAFRVTCSVCGKADNMAQYFKIAAGAEIPAPSLPSQWRVLDGKPICSEHEVVIRVTPKTVTVLVQQQNVFLPVL